VARRLELVSWMCNSDIRPGFKRLQPLEAVVSHKGPFKVRFSLCFCPYIFDRDTKSLSLPFSIVACRSLPADPPRRDLPLGGRPLRIRCKRMPHPRATWPAGEPSGGRPREPLAAGGLSVRIRPVLDANEHSLSRVTLCWAVRIMLDWGQIIDASQGLRPIP
jgi:hypothetical protein